MKRLGWCLLAGLGLCLGAQGVVWRHARGMTTFVPAGDRTPPPEALSMAGKLRVLLFGVQIPRPVATESPEAHGLVATEHEIAGPVGRLSLLVFPGGDEVVVVVHGYAAERSQLFPTVARLLDAGYTVVAPDLRGVGASAGNTTTLGFGEASDVVAVVGFCAEALGDPRPVLYGFSMGAAAVIGASGRLGIPVDGLVVEATFDRLRTTVGHRFTSMGLPARGPADLLLFWGGVQTGMDPDRIAPLDDARWVTAPALVVGGTADARVHPDEARAVADAFPDGHLAMIDGLPHAQLAKARPETWDAVVAPFLLAHAPP